MKRIYSLPAIGLLVAFLIGSSLAYAQNLFTVNIKGKGKPMLLIHGLYSSGEVWNETVDHYQNEYECHILTLAGFGGNSAALTENFLENVKDEVIAYTKNKKLKKPLLVGHSMGGFISLWAAASAPGTFDKVIAVDGLPFLPAVQIPGATVESSKPMAAQMRDMVGNLTPTQTYANQKMFLQSMISDAERIEQVAKLAMRADAKTQGQVMYEMFTTDLRETLSAIDCPVLLLGAWIGYKDYGVTHESNLKAYQTQVKSVKNCTVKMCDTAKHFIFYDDPQWFFEKVNAFIKKA